MDNTAEGAGGIGVAIGLGDIGRCGSSAAGGDAPQHLGIEIGSQPVWVRRWIRGFANCHLQYDRRRFVVSVDA